MYLSNGRCHLAIPGPSIVPDEVLQAMHIASPNIYDGELIKVTESLFPDLKSVARTDGNVAIYTSNGHGAWEAALANMVSAQDLILVVATGHFAHGWAEMAIRLGINVEIVEFGNSSSIDPCILEEVVKKDKNKKIKAVLVTHVDTSTSVMNDIVSVRKILDLYNHPALIAVDCIASLGCDVFEMDAWGVDVMVSACQKGLMVPAGISFVFFNDKAKAIQRSLPNVSSYWDWLPRIEPENFYQYFCGTAPTHHIFGLRKSLDLILQEGLKNVWGRHRRLAEAIWAAVECWSHNHGVMEFNIKNPDHRSSAVTTLKLGKEYGKQLRNWTEKRAGLTLGIGLGMSSKTDPNSDGYFRLGHMGHVNATMILGAIGTIEAGLIALKIPHGSSASQMAAQKIASTTFPSL